LTGGAFIEAGVMDSHGMDSDDNTLNNLLWHQLVTLREAEDGDGDMWFPKVTFKTPDYPEDSPAWASANLGLVTARGKTSVSGEFVIQINLRRLGGGGDQGDPVNWASVIAHEMLHNLGHKHEPNHYTDDRQINVFQHAIYWNGRYSKGDRVPPFFCRPGM
jgi:hypothetical protein